ncbi:MULTISPECIES: hypothetical protein [unclassified Nodularia (in: cyanobacteria)]|uniref:hypothetical protein n=1 Tax=unclassified Nodularia (in: cyanobacteria) TaxID=2656917 RepID=UPI00187E7250|nr:MULTISPECIES: hypothetical protein [unclassified Nodularia (in: cyanobacteria)]MBE9200955.1 hypothetical protein [Nodularia sp. LEGE 06071]MCC2692459.1 hypothetical protein [Nodularia sp. LEGE 04288]
MSQLPDSSDSQQPDANAPHQTDTAVNHNLNQGNDIRAIQGNGNNNNILGDNNTVNNNYYYPYLLNRDLKPLTLFGKLVSYFQVIFFLLGTLIFWLLFGFFTDYSFPYAQTIELLLCCFTGKIAAKVNNFQQQVQKNEFASQLDNHEQVKKLNKLESQIWLYEKIIARLSTNGNGSHERVAKTLEVLEQKRNLVENELEPRRPKKYQTLNRIQKFFQALIISEEEKDYIQIENLVNSMNKIQTSEIIFVEELLDKISKDIKAKETQISPKRLKLIYKIEQLIKKISSLNIYKNDGNEDIKKFQKIINDLGYQRDVAIENLEEKLVDYNLRLHEIDNLYKNIKKCENYISQLNSQIIDFREEINKLNGIKTNQQNQILLLNQELSRKNSLENQQKILNSQIEKLLQEQHQYKVKIENLNQEIRKQSQEISRKLRGSEYIGILTNENYHFHRDCNHWKSLALEYMMYDNKRKIYINTNPSIFQKHGLKACSFCQEKSRR